jgi:hypothetical protein
MGYIILGIIIIGLIYYVFNDSKKTRERDRKLSEAEVRAIYEDKTAVNEARRENNEIGRLYQTEFASQDLIDDQRGVRYNEEFEKDLKFDLPKDINTVGKYYGTQYSEKDQVDEEFSQDQDFGSLSKGINQMDSVEQVLQNAYQEQHRSDAELGLTNKTNNQNRQGDQR